MVVIGPLFWFIFNSEGRGLDSESRAYAADTVMAITRHWDSGELWRRSTPHLNASA